MPGFFLEFPDDGELGTSITAAITQAQELLAETQALKAEIESLNAAIVISQLQTIQADVTQKASDATAARDQAQSFASASTAASTAADRSEAAAAAAAQAKQEAIEAQNAANSLAISASNSAAIADNAANDAITYATDAQKFAEHPAGEDFTIADAPDTNHRSALSAAKDAADIATLALAIPSVSISSFPGDAAQLDAAHLFKHVRIKNGATDVTLNSVPTIWEAPTPPAGIDEMMGWMAVTREGSGTVTFAGGGLVADTLTILGSVVHKDANGSGLTGPFTTATTLKAGTRRRAYVFVTARYSNTNASRSHTITIAGQTVTTVQDATYLDNLSPALSVHVADIGTNGSDTTPNITFSTTGTGLVSYSLIVVTVGYCSGENGTVYTRTTSSGSRVMTSTMTPTGANTIVFVMYTGMKPGGDPIVVTNTNTPAGTMNTIQSGYTNSPGSDTVDHCYYLGYETVAVGGSPRNYSSLYAVAEAKASLAMAVTPSSATGSGSFSSPGGTLAIGDQYQTVYLRFPADQSTIFISDI